MKKTLTTITLAAVMAFGSTLALAKDGIMISDFSGNETKCTEGIIVADIVGIIVADLTGIIVADLAGQDAQCKDEGIIVADATGIIVAD